MANNTLGFGEDMVLATPFQYLLKRGNQAFDRGFTQEYLAFISTDAYTHDLVTA